MITVAQGEYYHLCKYIFLFKYKQYLQTVALFYNLTLYCQIFCQIKYECMAGNCHCDFRFVKVSLLIMKSFSSFKCSYNFMFTKQLPLCCSRRYTISHHQW